MIAFTSEILKLSELIYMLVRRFIKTSSAILMSSALLAGHLLMPTPAEAGATLYFSPSSANLKPNQTWSVKVMVNTTESTAAIKYTVLFPSNVLSAVNASCGSTFSTPVSTNIANGSVSGDCAALGQGNAYKGGAGHVATINFKAKSSGSGALSFGASTVVRNGGDFGNMYTGGGSANVSIVAPVQPSGGSSPKPTATPQPSSGGGQSSTPAPTPPPNTGVAAPAISSSTHPDQSKWYKERKIEFNWNSGGDGFNYALDSSADTQLPNSVRDTTTSYSHTVDKDGVYYLHVRRKSGNDWSGTAHYRVQIDSEAPTDVEIRVDPKSPMTVLPKITMKATDTASGIDRYEVKIGDGDWQKVGSGYKPKTLTSGKHVIAGRAYDRAGNMAEVEREIDIVPLASPELIAPKAGILMLGESFVVEGKAVPNTTVEIYINDELKETVKSDEEGYFVSTEEYRLFPGNYTVAARAANGDGITSPMSESVMVTIDAQAVNVMGMVLPGWGVYGGVGLSMTAVIAGLMWGLYRLWRKTRLWMGRLKWVDKSVDVELAELQQQLSQSIEANAASMSPETVAALKKQLAASVKEAEEDIGQVLGEAGEGSVALKEGGLSARLSGMWAMMGGVVVNGVVFVAGLVKGRRGEGDQSTVDSRQSTVEVGDEDLALAPKESQQAEDRRQKAVEVGDEDSTPPPTSDLQPPKKNESTVDSREFAVKGGVEDSNRPPSSQRQQADLHGRQATSDLRPPKEGADSPRPAEEKFEKIPGVEDILGDDV